MMTMSQAAAAYREACRRAAEAKGARKDAEERAHAAVEADRAAQTAKDNARLVLDAAIARECEGRE